MMYGERAADMFIRSLRPGMRVLDVGAGDDGHGFGVMCRDKGLIYDPLDLRDGIDWESESLVPIAHTYDGVYMCHSLEHMQDTHSALRRIHSVIKPDGVIGITVPPLKHTIVGGHVSLWNAGLLLYRLAVAGFDCRLAAVSTYGYNCSVVVRYKQIENMPRLVRDHGDVDRLGPYLPPGCGEGFDGQIKSMNWGAV